MKRETIWQTSVVTTAEAEEAVANLLAARHPCGTSTYTDVETGVTTVSVYETAKPRNIAEAKRALTDGLKEIYSCGLNVGQARVHIRKLARRNWAESWKRHFPPLEIGDRLLVRPSWSKRKPRPGQALIVLDPGLSFGTGQHPTTEFCLRELVRFRGGPRSFLDVGTGSGILAIAAAKLGFAPVHALDFDPQCIRVARANARINQVQTKLRITRADLTKLPRRAARRYDFICANLLADLLIAERHRIVARLKLGGVLVVAGILKREFSEVHRAYAAAGLRLVASKTQNEWQSGTFRRNSIWPQDGWLRPKIALEKS